MDLRWDWCLLSLFTAAASDITIVLYGGKVVPSIASAKLKLGCLTRHNITVGMGSSVADMFLQLQDILTWADLPCAEELVITLLVAKFVKGLFKRQRHICQVQPAEAVSDHVADSWSRHTATDPGGRSCPPDVEVNLVPCEQGLKSPRLHSINVDATILRKRTVRSLDLAYNVKIIFNRVSKDELVQSSFGSDPEFLVRNEAARRTYLPRG